MGDNYIPTSIQLANLPISLPISDESTYVDMTDINSGRRESVCVEVRLAINVEFTWEFLEDVEHNPAFRLMNTTGYAEGICNDARPWGITNIRMDRNIMSRTYLMRADVFPLPRQQPASAAPVTARLAITKRRRSLDL